MSDWIIVILCRNKGFELKDVPAFLEVHGNLQFSLIWMCLEVIPKGTSTSLRCALRSRAEPCIGVCMWKWIITHMNYNSQNVFSFSRLLSPPLSHTWWTVVRCSRYQYFSSLKLLSDKQVHLLNFCPTGTLSSHLLIFLGLFFILSSVFSPDFTLFAKVVLDLLLS